MTVNGTDIWRTIGYLEADTKGLLTKLHDLRMMLAAVELPKEETGDVCERCPGGLRVPKGALQDHLANVHGVDA